MSKTSTTLPARYYTGADLFRSEMERFYFGRWIHAGREERIAREGEYFLCDVGGESVIVTRDTSGAPRAFFNVCRHRGTRMCTSQEGAFAGGRIRCPYHAWTYGLDGALLGAPHMGEAFDKASYPLHGVRAEIWDGHIFLHMGAAPEPLLRQLGDLPEKFSPWQMKQLRSHSRIAYNVKANWKLIVLNYNECLHCPGLHPALNRLTNYLGAANEEPTRDYIGGTMGFREGVNTMSIDGVLRRDYLPGLDSEQRTRVAYYTILPNLLLSLHPDYVMTHTLWPKSVNETEVVCEWLFHPNELAKPDFTAEDAISFWDLTNREDWGISEQSQLGISSRAYTPGPYSPREELLHAFDCIVTGEE